jgi:hypothetical protein
MYKIITDDEDNIDALIILLKAGVDPDGGVDSYVSRDFINDRYETTCSYDCIENGSPRKLQIMLASGKCSFYWPYYEEYGDKHTPCLESLSNRHTENWEAKHRILISNGYHDDDKLLDRYGIEFQKLRFSYVQCRKVIVTLLALKRRRIRSMGHLDRFLLRVLAVCIYTTRESVEWSKYQVCWKEVGTMAENGVLMECLQKDIHPSLYNSRSRENRTILHYACCSVEYENVVSMLLHKYHVDVNVVADSVREETSLDNAIEYGTGKMVHMLCTHNAKIGDAMGKYFQQTGNKHIFEFKQKMCVLHNHYERRKRCFAVCKVVAGILNRSHISVLKCITRAIWGTRSSEEWNLPRPKLKQGKL